MRSTGAHKLTSFLRNIVKDWLFVVQLLLLTALALTFAKPFSTYLQDVTAQNTIIVLDVSASSQVFENGQTRFDNGLAKAKESLSSRNTIILAKDVPLIGVKDAAYDEAYRFLQSIKPKETTTRLGEAIIVAGEALSGDGRVIVISDFINTDGQDPHIAKAILESKGLKVTFISTAENKRSNVGITDLLADDTSTTIYVKNYDAVQHTVPLTIAGTTTQLNLAAKATETHSFQTPQGVTKITLDFKDDFNVDNTAFLSAPIKKHTKALLITNNESVFIKNGVVASGDVTLDIARPPVIPKEKYDIYIIHNIDADQLLPGTFDDIADIIEEGATVIVHIQEDSPGIDYKELTPVSIGGRKDSASIRTEQLNRFTKNIDFGSVDYFFTTNPKEDTITVASADTNSIITVGKYGNGKRIYFGIPEKASDFKFSPSYPIFWTELIRFATEQQEIKNLNYKTGDSLIFDVPQDVQTPSSLAKQPTLLLEEVGLYKLPDRTIAVNLLNERESNINADASFGTQSINFKLEPIREERTSSLEFVLVTIGLFLLIFEIMFIKWRGDL